MRGANGPQNQSVDVADVERWALAYLARYGTSAEHLKRVLRRRALRQSGGDAETASAGYRIIDWVVARYRAAGLVDDAAFAAGRARRGLARGRPPARIAAELAAKGVHAEDCDAALAALREEIVDPELAAAAAFARRRRLGPFGLASSDRGRELAAFARAGFSRRAAETVLSCPDEAAVVALLGAGG